MRRGYIFLEILMGVALAGLVFVGAVAMFGDMRLQLQQRQMDTAARWFIADCRMIQQGNMFSIRENIFGEDTIFNHKRIVAPYDKEYYAIDFYNTGLATDTYSFRDMGCGGVYFSTMNDIIEFSGLGSINRATYIVLKHRDNKDLQLTLNLQPVTGRIEIENN